MIFSPMLESASLESSLVSAMIFSIGWAWRNWKFSHTVPPFVQGLTPHKNVSMPVIDPEKSSGSSVTKVLSAGEMYLHYLFLCPACSTRIMHQDLIFGEFWIAIASSFSLFLCLSSKLLPWTWDMKGFMFSFNTGTWFVVSYWSVHTHGFVDILCSCSGINFYNFAL